MAAAIAKAFTRAFPVSSFQLDMLKGVGLLCGAALVAFLLRASYGLDISAGFF
jgi:hypothetical protein